MDHAGTLDDIVRWAGRTDEIRAVVLTGSGATDAGPAEWSDLDVEIYTRDPAALLDRTDWYAAFGDVLVVEALENPEWHPTRLIYYVDGKIDFAIAPAEAFGAEPYDRPFRALVDKDGAADRLRLEVPAYRPPTDTEFLECVHWFFAAALMEAKAAVRGELWAAKVRDGDLKEQLLRLVEWDHRARHGDAYETWYLGNHMQEWIDADVRAELLECWGRFDAADTARSLRASVELFDRLADRTADSLGHARFDHGPAGREIERILHHLS